MTKHIFIIILLGIYAGNNMNACDPTKKLQQLLRRLEDKKNRNTRETQINALDMLKDNHHISQEGLNRALDILLFHNETTQIQFPILRSRIESIDHAIKLFDGTAGFRTLLIHVINESCLSHFLISHWYELYAALSIHNSYSPYEQIVAFGNPPDYTTGTPQGGAYNIITNRRWITCKTIDWGSHEYTTGKKLRTLRKNLLTQSCDIAEYNTQLKYEIISLHPLSRAWSQWLSDYDIPHQIIPF